MYEGKCGVEENGCEERVIPRVLPFVAVPIVANMLASMKATQFGMTATELNGEFLLVAIYAMAGFLGVLLANRLTKNRKIQFGVKALLFVSTLALAYNQVRISRELAPVKTEFAQAAANCHPKSGGLVCGPELKQVLARRDAELKRLHAVRFGDWRVTALTSSNYLFDRDSVYLHIPF
jgi:hypothetical protein